MCGGGSLPQVEMMLDGQRWRRHAEHETSPARLEVDGRLHHDACVVRLLLTEPATLACLDARGGVGLRLARARVLAPRVAAMQRRDKRARAPAALELLPPGAATPPRLDPAAAPARKLALSLHRPTEVPTHSCLELLCLQRAHTTDRPV